MNSSKKSGPKSLRLHGDVLEDVSRIARDFGISNHGVMERALHLGVRIFRREHSWLSGRGEGMARSLDVLRSDSSDIHSFAQHSCVTHFNGGRPFRVKVYGDRVDVFTFEKWRMESTVYKKPVTSFSKYRRCWFGFDSSGLGLHGNTVLVELARSAAVVSSKSKDLPYRYAYIGGDQIYEFETSDSIVSYVSPVGNSDVPYPVAYGTENTYFLLEQRYVPNGDIKTPRTVLDTEDVVSEFYGWIRNGKRITSDRNRKQMPSVSMKGISVIYGKEEIF